MLLPSVTVGQGFPWAHVLIYKMGGSITGL